MQTKDFSMVKTEEALAIIGGHVDEELLLRNEYLAIENEILRKKIEGRIKLSQCFLMRTGTSSNDTSVSEDRGGCVQAEPRGIGSRIHSYSVGTLPEKLV